MATDLLTPASVVPFLRGHGLLDETRVTVCELGGGVSNVVLLVEQRDARLVIKQALPRLRTTAAWFAPVARTLTEADAIELAGHAIPAKAPRLRLVDRDACVIAMDAAPTDWVDWKSMLMAGVVSPSVASALGSTLAAFHTSTLNRPVTASLAAPDAFEVLRLLPYYETTASALTDATAARLRELADGLRTSRRVVVHGDFSPKNILVGPDGPEHVCVIDWEVATLGDPAFDVAFLLNHLALKALHMPESARTLDATSLAFAASYTAAVHTDLAPDWRTIGSHVGALLLARVHGTSPADYLTRRGQQQADALGRALLPGVDGPTDIVAVRQRIGNA